MTTMRLRTKILFGILTIIVLLGMIMSSYGFFVLKRHIVDEAQKQVNQDLKTVRSVYNERLNQMRIALKFIRPYDHLEGIRKELGLDYLLLVDRQDLPRVDSEIVRAVFERRKGLAGTRILSPEEVSRIKPGLVIPLKDTPRARPTDRVELRSAMSMEYARPVLNNRGDVQQVLYGGKIINGNARLIDSIADVVFENEMYDHKPLGTVTIFQDDVRIATNVLDTDGERAVGTRVSEEVYHKVVEQGERWFDRAFVVTDWYITAYEPIRNSDGQIIGILYIGRQEHPFIVVRERLFAGLMMIIIISIFPTIIFSLVVARSLTRPLTEIVQKSARIAHGELEHKIQTPTDIREIKELADSFNHMSQKLVERDKSLAVSNEKLAVMNKRYLDLIGFVSHELKGILSSIVLNTYLLRKRILGEINEKQDNVLTSMARNLDYLTVTVKNFLNLSRIEKDELRIDKQELRIKDHIINPALDSFRQQAEEKDIRVVVKADPAMTVPADPGLMQIVMNNLISNAVKYGQPGGQIRITAREHDDAVEIEVYNDGEPIASVDLPKLFRKFSRVVYRGMETVKGTGIGLFISREIVEKHGGTIWVEPALKGNAFKFQIKKT